MTAAGVKVEGVVTAGSAAATVTAAQASMEVDDSATESEYYDEGEADIDDEHTDTLGGVSRQSTSVAPPPASLTTAAASAWLAADVHNMEHSASFANAAALRNGVPVHAAHMKIDPHSSGSAFAAPTGPAFMKHEPRTGATTTTSPPHSDNSALVVKPESAVLPTYASAQQQQQHHDSPPAPATATVTALPSVPPVTGVVNHTLSAVVPPFAPQTQHWQHPALTQSTHGYQPPPPVHFAPPLPHRSSVDASANLATSATRYSAPVSPPTTTPPPQTHSKTHMLSCVKCNATVVPPPQTYDSTAVCVCCGNAYPPSRFPKHGKKKPMYVKLRCHACFAVFLIRKKEAAANRPGLVVTTRAQAAQAAQHAAHEAMNAQETSAANRPSPVTAPAPSPSAPQSSPSPTHPKCSTCSRLIYAQAPPSKGRAMKKFIVCNCCGLELPGDVCYSATQRSGSRNKCKACCNNVTFDANGDATDRQLKPSQETLARAAQRRQKRALGLPDDDALLTAEREVAKYHEARRALERKRMANDLRGATRVAYEYELAAEQQRITALGRRLQVQYPALFDRATGIQVVTPHMDRESWKAEKIKATKKLKAKTAKVKAKPVTTKKATRAKHEQERRVTTAAANVIAAAMRSNSSASTQQQQHAPVVIDMTADASPMLSSSTRTRALPTVLDLAPTAASASTPATRAVKPVRSTTAAAAKTKAKAPAAPKRKAATATTTASRSATNSEQPAKKPKREQAAVRGSNSNNHDGDHDDPWLAAQNEIAKGLSSLLGANLDDVLRTGTNSTSSSSRIHIQPKQRASLSLKPPADNSVYAPKTTLQAETPPRSTVVTRARKRLLPSTDVIDITDD